MCIWTDLAANVVVVYSLHTIGSTGKAAMLLKQYNYIGIDLSAEYIEISKARIEAAILKHKEPDKEPSKDKDKEEDTQYFFDNI